ncbi:MAG: response regulator [Campylobacterota bacterium]|nr:response regulator [Campylobacterota bacterium]
MEIDNKLILENSKNLTVLYVEDDDHLRDTTFRLFENYFAKVDVAIDGKDGYTKYISYFEKTNRYYDIVISDISMPNMDGIEMSRKIKDINFEQPTILVTAFNETSYLHSAIELGVDRFLTKPMEMQQLKKVFYKTTQRISDRKIVEGHYKQLEDINILNIDKIDATNFDSAKDIIYNLEENKEKISHLWMNDVVIHDRLESHSIDVEFFRTHYGIKVVEYFLSVIKGDSELGNCPVIFIMLDFFKHKHLPLEDIFMICVLFKNTVTAYIFDRYSFNHKLFDDISHILDKNFEGVIINYLKIKSEFKDEVVPDVLEEIKSDDLEEDINHINYIEYVLDSDLYELQDLEQDIDSLAISVTSSKASVESFTELSYKIKRYGEILKNYPLFSQLGIYIIKLGVNINDNAQLLFDDKDRMSHITGLIEAFVNDLIVWRKEIFDNNIQNPHFLDSSFFSNVDTIIMFIEYNDSIDNIDSIDDEDIEFF